MGNRDRFLFVNFKKNAQKQRDIFAKLKRISEEKKKSNSFFFFVLLWSGSNNLKFTCNILISFKYWN